MLVVGLTFGVGDARRLRLAPLTGADERAAAGDAHRLLERLADGGDGWIRPAEVGNLPLGDRDRALAALYAHLYGEQVVADARCPGCDRRFELRFSLTALAASRVPDGSAAGDPPQVKVEGATLRLACARDLDGSPDALIARLLLDGAPPPLEVAEAALEAADPALEIDLAGTCPECGADQKVPFSMRRFFSAALKRDEAFLLREVHLIARAYGWAFDAILGLTREERHAFVRLLLAEREAEGTAWRLVS